MTTLSTHVLDTSIGKPAAGVRIELERVDAGGTTLTAGTVSTRSLPPSDFVPPRSEGVTDKDGRVPDLTHPDWVFDRGTWRLTFHIGEYFTASKRDSFFPIVEIVFDVTSDDHHHVPLLVSPYGYSTYRGS